MLDTDESICTAIIYSISDLAEYIVEIRQHNKSNFISTNGMPNKYGNLADARLAAKENHAQRLFLALNKTHQEVEVGNTNQSGDYFDYMPLDT